MGWCLHRAEVVAIGFVACVMTGLLLGVASSAAALPRNDYLLVLRQRAGPFRFVDTLQDGGPNTYLVAVAAFGKPTSFKTEYLRVDRPRTAGYCHVTWANPGVTVKLFSFSGWWPPSDDQGQVPTIQPCSASELATAFFLELRLFGPRWHNRRGIQVGAPIRSGTPRLVRASVPGTRWGGEGARDDLELHGNVDHDGRVTSIDVMVLGAP